MQPLKPSVKKDILDANPMAAPEDIEEYERLLSKRFTVDPDYPASSPGVRGFGAAPTPDDEQRIRELHAKLFGKATSRP